MKSYKRSAASLLVTTSVSLGASYDESVDGDLSNDRLSTTMITLDAASNPVSGSVTAQTLQSPLDRDYFSVTVPAGRSLTQIQFERYESSNPRAFIGMLAGSVFSIDPDNPTTDGLLGYLHIGEQAIPSDILDDLRGSFGPTRFQSPLAAGTYSFWVNQTEAALTEYTFNFVTIPEPHSMVAAAGLGLILRRRR